jgi:hypothetical protein
MASAAEARFRIQAPNSRPRAVKVMALDAASEPVVRRLAGRGWAHAQFFTASDTSEGSLTAIAGESQALPAPTAERPIQAEVDEADLVVMIATPGGRAAAAPAIGRACSARRVMTTALIVGTASASDEAVSKTLAQVRPWSLMVVIADAPDYVDDMLDALRA